MVGLDFVPLLNLIESFETASNTRSVGAPAVANFDRSGETAHQESVGKVNAPDGVCGGMLE